jgi:hypothetical protein
LVKQQEELGRFAKLSCSVQLEESMGSNSLQVAALYQLGSMFIGAVLWKTCFSGWLMLVRRSKDTAGYFLSVISSRSLMLSVLLFGMVMTTTGNSQANQKSVSKPGLQVVSTNVQTTFQPLIFVQCII